MGVNSICTVVWLSGISGGIQKCHMQAYLYMVVINNRRQGHIFQNMGGSSCVDKLAMYSLVYLRSSIGLGQIREMVWTACRNLSHNKLCGNSVIYGVLESSLRVTIDYNSLCIRVFFINRVWILFEHNVNTPWSLGLKRFAIRRRLTVGVKSVLIAV